MAVYIFKSSIRLSGQRKVDRSNGRQRNKEETNKNKRINEGNEKGKN